MASTCSFSSDLLFCIVCFYFFKCLAGDYDAFQCTSSHCVPCSLRFPSCSGLPDGKHSWAGREWSPYYVVCEEERVIFQGECEGEKSAQVFHPEQRECVEIDEKTVIG